MWTNQAIFPQLLGHPQEESVAKVPVQFGRVLADKGGLWGVPPQLVDLVVSHLWLSSG